MRSAATARGAIVGSASNRAAVSLMLAAKLFLQQSGESLNAALGVQFVVDDLNAVPLTRLHHFNRFIPVERNLFVVGANDEKVHVFHGQSQYRCWVSKWL